MGQQEADLSIKLLTRGDVATLQCQLSTGTINIESTTATGGHLTVVMATDFLPETFDCFVVGRLEGGAFEGVEGQQVDVTVAFAGKGCQGQCFLDVVIDPGQYHVLQADTADRIAQSGECIEKFRQGMFGLNRNDACTGFIDGTVKADRQANLGMLFDQGTNLWNDADGGNRDPAGTHPKGFRRSQPVQGSGHGGKIMQRFTHTHEDDLGDTDLALLSSHAIDRMPLADDFTGGEVSGQLHRPC